MSDAVKLHIVGLAAPKGSGTKLANGGFMQGRNAAQSRSIVAWEQAVCRAAEPIVLAGHQPFDEPVCVRGWIAFPTVASDPHRYYHQGTPDLDKLLRNCGDALTKSGIVKDDGRISWWDVRKLYAVDGHHIGAELAVIPMGEAEMQYRLQSREAQRLERDAAKRAAKASRVGMHLEETLL